MLVSLAFFLACSGSSTPIVDPDAGADADADTDADADSDADTDADADSDADTDADSDTDADTDTDTDAPCREPVVLVLEAEDAVLNDSYDVTTSVYAEIGDYVVDPGGWYRDPGQATFAVDIRCEGTYRVWGRGFWNSYSEDSVYVNVDASGDQIWDLLQCPFYYPPSQAWYWDLVSGRVIEDQCTGDTITDPRVLDLGVGAHTLVLTTREPGLAIDKFVVTNDDAYDPAADWPLP